MALKSLLGAMIVVLLIIVLGCSTPEERFQSQIDKAVIEEFSYSEFSYEGFSVDYPDWPAAESDVELSVTKGYCSVSINTEKIPAEQWLRMITESVEEQKGIIIESDSSQNIVTYSMPYHDFMMISENRIYDCGGNGIAVTISCIEQAYKDTEDMRREIFSSARCRDSLIEEKKEDMLLQEKTSYSTYSEGDFYARYPEWNLLQDSSEHKIGVSRGVCSVIVDSHNAISKDIHEWYLKHIKESRNSLISSSENRGEYSIVYDMPYEDKMVRSTSRIIYCNYQSYVTQVLCVEDLITEELDSARAIVIESAGCSKEYEAPTPEKIEEEKKQAEKDDPKAIEEIRESIVQTDAGREFGIDEEAVVYFINSNDFFTKIMKDFPKANIVIEDQDNQRELELRVKIDNQGRISLLEDGRYNDADITLKVPLRDALNIFGNAQNINPITLLGFAANVQTEPPEIKDEVIQKVLRGEYS